MSLPCLHACLYSIYLMLLPSFDKIIVFVYKWTSFDDFSADYFAVMKSSSNIFILVNGQLHYKNKHNFKV